MYRCIATRRGELFCYTPPETYHVIWQVESTPKDKAAAQEAAAAAAREAQARAQQENQRRKEKAAQRKQKATEKRKAREAELKAQEAAAKAEVSMLRLWRMDACFASDRIVFLIFWMMSVSVG